MKILAFLLFISAIIPCCFGQYSSIPNTYSANTTHGNIQHTYYTPAPSTPTGYVKLSKKYDFTVTLTNGSVSYMRGKIDVFVSTHSLVIKSGTSKRIIRPQDTKAIHRYSLVDGHKIAGVPTDSCWLFMVEDGRIKMYAKLPFEGAKAVVAIQRGENGTIVPLSRKNLIAITGEDQRLMPFIQNKEYVKAIWNYNSIDFM